MESHITSLQAWVCYGDQSTLVSIAALSFGYQLKTGLNHVFQWNLTNNLCVINDVIPYIRIHSCISFVLPVNVVHFYWIWALVSILQDV